MSSRPMVFSTLSIYSWSLFQFTLNLVVTRGRSSGSASSIKSSKSSATVITNSSGKVIGDKKRSDNSESIHNELWNVMITLMMQDCPFFILRSVCVFKFNVVSYLFLFFTFKNGILFSLQIYRIIAICTDNDYNYDPAKDSSEIISNAVTTIGNGMINVNLLTDSFDQSCIINSKSESQIQTLYIETD